MVRAITLSSPSTSPQKDALSAFTQQVRLVRGHYEPIDFLALLIGYAIRGERRLPDFFERLSPFGAAFMALFGRASLPHRSSLSRFLADVGGPCARSLSGAFRALQLSEMHGPRKPLAASSTGRVAVTLFLMSMRHARRHDNVPYLAIQRFLLQGVASSPSVPRVTSGASGVRWYTHVPQRAEMHTRQWVGTYGGRGNGDYQRELASALRSIATYLQHFALTPEVALVRLDGQYGDAVVIAQRDTRRGST